MNKSILLFFIMFQFMPASYSQQQNKNYLDLVKRIQVERDTLNQAYQKSGNVQKDSIIRVARQFVFYSITHDLFQFWYGTPWSFYGQTFVPRQGSIACGYFVTGILRDAGFNIPWYEWANLASESFIVRLSPDIKRFYMRPVAEVKAYIKNRDNGLYIVGLDCHVGFIYKNDSLVKFVHSNYYQPLTGVMAEDFETKNPLRDSKYRVIGRLLDDNMVISWITFKRIQ